MGKNRKSHRKFHYLGRSWTYSSGKVDCKGVSLSSTDDIRDIIVSLLLNPVPGSQNNEVAVLGLNISGDKASSEMRNWHVITQ